ncbi:kelch domain-containing protein 7A [Struthio camelus]|uniref:kelch domain-containing protein 7A n=1 Tax=Struthio camelus TaxID=8801 RepID=UPI00360405FB
MIPQVSPDWQSNMRLAGQLVLSAAALLLLTLAFRFYKSRAPAGTAGGKTARADARGETGQSENPAPAGAREGADAGEKPPGLRRRRIGAGAPPRAEQRLPPGEEEEGELGRQPVSEPRTKAPAGAGGGEPSSSGLGDPAAAPRGRRQEESGGEQGTLCPGAGLGLGIPPARAAGDGRAQSAEQDLAGRAGLARPREAQASGERIQTLSVTSDLGLTITASSVGLDTSYSFSSVAKIQVEENYIAERLGKAGADQAAPTASGLKGKVYDYYVQSTSQSVSKKRSRPCVHPGIHPLPSSKQVTEELRGFETWLHECRSHQAAPASETPGHGRASLPRADPVASPVLPRPAGSSAVSRGGGAGTETGPSSAAAPEPPAPARPFSRKDSVLQIAENPDLQLRMDGFGVSTPASGTAGAGTPPASPCCAAPCPQPRLELVAGASFFQMPPALESTPDIRLDLGNCYEVLCMAKAQKLGHLQEAAYKVMSDNYLQVLRNPSIYGRLNARERELILQRRMKGKKCIAVADISSTQELGLHASRLCYYDDGGDRWHHLCHVPPEAVSRGCAMCSMFNYLFVVAGCEGLGRARRPSNRVFCYNPLTNIWQEICPLNQARPHCKLVALDGCLYAIGGECLYTVERYDPRQDRWAFAAPLPNDTFAVAHTATVCDGEIYVTGGTLRYLLLRYAARSNSWKIGLTGGSKDRTVEMVTANGFLYRFDLNRSRGIGVYRCSAKAKLWYECATYAMPYPACFQCAVVGSLVHCVGRHFHICFLADHISPRFGPKELQPFPAPRGSLLPVVLVLPEPGTAQTRV